MYEESTICFHDRVSSQMEWGVSLGRLGVLGGVLAGEGFDSSSEEYVISLDSDYIGSKINQPAIELVV